MDPLYIPDFHSYDDLSIDPLIVQSANYSEYSLGENVKYTQEIDCSLDRSKRLITRKCNKANATEQKNHDVKKDAKRQNFNQKINRKKLKFTLQYTHPCRICSYKAQRRDHLRKHILRIHSDPQPIKCEECDFVGKNLPIVEAHRKYKHMFKFPCHICNDTFAMKESLDQHIKYHKEWYCQICKKFYSRKFHFNIHMLKHK